ncbi:MAG: 3-oxoacyl-ACP reductase FabG [Gammaproteobacteria bacterium]|nr:3-oxoacyl-ACP reductase FabG [Gammaproteobacteria bacterium]MBU1645874.1 3-oxoacyl-ACP reductase FabG [Gammaproteobacteria bacterium]MBU1971936.1 3-oxoacyl-ACP reductase FabG [Gammaproteobacteria bacterium]
MKLRDRIVVVTGGAQGIGLAIGERCAREGATVVIWDVRPAAIDAAVAHIIAVAPGAKVSGAVVDVAVLADVTRAAGEVLAHHGRIDGLVNNAGIVADAQLKKMTEEQWDRVIGINLKGVFNCGRAFVEAFLAQGGGSIVNISSVVGLYGNFGQTNYVAAKAGVIGMTLTWAKELGRKGIRSNAICPGFIATPILDAMPPQTLEALVARVPLGRMGKPEDIAATVAFLLSDDAGYINGATIEVTGGLSL